MSECEVLGSFSSISLPISLHFPLESELIAGHSTPLNLKNTG
jgi:hypothetical protein